MESFQNKNLTTQKKEGNSFNRNLNRPQTNNSNQHSNPTLKNSNNMGKNITILEPEIVERKNWELKHGGIALGIAIGLILIQFGVMTLADLNATNAWILAFVLVTIFGVSIYFLMEPKKEREIKQRIIETELKSVDRPVIKEVIKTVEVEKPIVKEVPILKEIQVYREPKTVYADYTPIKRSSKRKSYMTYDFIGSEQTKTYHRANCRLGKSIIAKYKLKGSTASFFRKKGYSSCKVCKPNR
jgi:hypothetical protein